MQKPHNPVSKIMRSILPSAFAGLDASASPDTQGLFYQNHLPDARSGFGVSGGFGGQSPLILRVLALVRRSRSWSELI